MNIQQAFRAGYEFDNLMVAHEFENVSVSSTLKFKSGDALTSCIEIVYVELHWCYKSLCNSDSEGCGPVIAHHSVATLVDIEGHLDQLHLDNC